MWEVFNMGCGFVAVVPEADAAAAVAILARHHPGARRIGTITADADRSPCRRSASPATPPGCVSPDERPR